MYNIHRNIVSSDSQFGATYSLERKVAKLYMRDSHNWYNSQNKENNEREKGGSLQVEMINSNYLLSCWKGRKRQIEKPSHV